MNSGDADSKNSLRGICCKPQSDFRTQPGVSAVNPREHRRKNSPGRAEE
jgi:hypothetical protein